MGNWRLREVKDLPRIMWLETGGHDIQTKVSLKIKLGHRFGGMFPLLSALHSPLEQVVKQEMSKFSRKKGPF